MRHHKITTFLLSTRSKGEFGGCFDFPAPPATKTADQGLIKPKWSKPNLVNLNKIELNNTNQSCKTQAGSTKRVQTKINQPKKPNQNKDLACVSQQCRDSFSGFFGGNAYCTATNHNAICQCCPGYTGNAFVDYQRITTVPPKDTEIPNQCNPSPCVVKWNFIQYFFGNPYQAFRHWPSSQPMADQIKQDQTEMDQTRPKQS